MLVEVNPPCSPFLGRPYSILQFPMTVIVEWARWDHWLEIIVRLTVGVRYLIEYISPVTISVDLQACRINVISRPERVPHVQWRSCDWGTVTDLLFYYTVILSSWESTVDRLDEGTLAGALNQEQWERVSRYGSLINEALLKPASQVLSNSVLSWRIAKVAEDSIAFCGERCLL